MFHSVLGIVQNNAGSGINIVVISGEFCSRNHISFVFFNLFICKIYKITKWYLAAQAYLNLQILSCFYGLLSPDVNVSCFLLLFILFLGDPLVAVKGFRITF